MAETKETTKLVKKTRIRTTDPFAYFPVDILELIFQNIPMNQILKCHTVSKLWYYTLTSIPRLYDFKCRANIALNEFVSGYDCLRKYALTQAPSWFNMLGLTMPVTNSIWQKC